MVTIIRSALSLSVAANMFTGLGVERQSRKITTSLSKLELV